MSNFSRSGGFRKSATSSMPNRFSAPPEQMPNTALLSSAPTGNGGGNVSTSMPPTLNVGGNVSTSMSDQSVASKSTGVKCVDWPGDVGRPTLMRGEQFDMKATFNNAKLLKQIVDQNAEKANLPRSLVRPQSQAAHQPTHHPLVNNCSAVGGGSGAVLPDTLVHADTAWPLRQKLSSDIATKAVAPANTQPHVSGFKKARDPVTTTPELSALEQTQNAGWKPGVNPNKVFYERSDSSISVTSAEISPPKRVDTMGSELAKMRRLQEIMKAIQQNPILEDLVKNTMSTIKKFADLNEEDSKLLDTCFAYRY